MFLCLFIILIYVYSKQEILFYGELIKRENHKYETDVSYLSLADQ